MRTRHPGIDRLSACGVRVAVLALLAVPSIASCSTDTDRYGHDPSIRYGRDVVFEHVLGSRNGEGAEEGCRRRVRTPPSPPIPDYDAKLALKGCLEGVREVLK
jgi:hypothetical protein